MLCYFYDVFIGKLTLHASQFLITFVHVNKNTIDIFVSYSTMSFSSADKIFYWYLVTRKQMWSIIVLQWKLKYEIKSVTFKWNKYLNYYYLRCWGTWITQQNFIFIYSYRKSKAPNFHYRKPLWWFFRINFQQWHWDDVLSSGYKYK